MTECPIFYLKMLTFSGSRKGTECQFPFVYSEETLSKQLTLYEKNHRYSSMRVSCEEEEMEWRPRMVSAQVIATGHIAEILKNVGKKFDI